MIRQDIEQQFTVCHGFIVSDGRYHGQPVFIPYYWAAVVEGAGADRQSQGRYYFDVILDDLLEFPELKGVRTVELWRDDETGKIESRLHWGPVAKSDRRGARGDG
jgi:hypothetical protein